MIAAQTTSGRDSSSDMRDTESTEEFITTVSAINTANAISNFLALFVILRARSGAARAVDDILGDSLVPWTGLWAVPDQLIALLGAVLISGLVAYILTLLIGRFFARKIDRIRYGPLVACLLIVLVVLSFLFAGLLGLVILTVATLIGYIPPKVGIKRVHLMGCLVIPLILSDLPFLAPWGLNM